MKSYLKARLKSFAYAYQGIKELFKSQPNAKIHLFIGIIAISGGIFFQISSIEWCLVILSCSLVLFAEAVNTSLEYLTDLACPQYHPLAGKAKDVAAGAVLISAIGAAIIGFIIFLPKVLQFIANLI